MVLNGSGGDFLWSVKNVRSVECFIHLRDVCDYQLTLGSTTASGAGY